MKLSKLSLSMGVRELPEPIIGGYVVHLKQSASQISSAFDIKHTSPVIYDRNFLVSSELYKQYPYEYKHLIQICDEPFPL
jgi:hypothetical protein